MTIKRYTKRQWLLEVVRIPLGTPSIIPSPSDLENSTIYRGLAFVITEENDHYSWYLTGIKKEMLKGLPLRFNLNKGAISLKNFSEAFHHEIKLEEQVFSSQLPKDLEIISSESNSKELFKKQLELTYD